MVRQHSDNIRALIAALPTADSGIAIRLAVSKRKSLLPVDLTKKSNGTDAHIADRAGTRSGFCGVTLNTPSIWTELLGIIEPCKVLSPDWLRPRLTFTR
ncbi:hypothetical protein D3C84_980580 [compost metagenome]